MPSLSRDEYQQAVAAAALAASNQKEYGLIVTASMILHVACIVSGASIEEILEAVRLVLEKTPVDGSIWDALPKN